LRTATGTSIGMVVRLLLGAAAVVLCALSPPLREAWVAVESTLSTALFVAAAVGALWGWAARLRGPEAVRRVRRLEADLGRALLRWGWVGAILCMLAPLWSQWALRPPGGTTALAALLGHLPWSDATGHFEGGMRLLTDGVFGSYSERRPLNAAWLAVRLWAFRGSLPLALASQAVIAGLAAFLLARVVALRFSLWPALGTFALVQGLVRDGIPTAATEPLGVTLGCLGLAVLLSGSARSRLSVAALGLFALDVALNARPGPQFLMPAVLLWGVVVFRSRWRRAVLVLVAAAAASALCTRALNAFYGAGEGSFTAYPAYTLYGLTRDSNYRQAQFDYGDTIERLGNEREVARFLYARAFESIRREPQVLVRALLGNELKFFGKLPANLARIVTLRAFFSTPEQSARPNVGARFWNLALGVPLLFGAAAAAIVFMARDRRYRGFWLATGAGILGSVPFVYGDAGFRALAAAYPVLALFFGLGLGARRRAPIGPAVARAERGLIRAALFMTLAIMLASLVLPAVAHRQWPRPTPALLREARPGVTMVARIEDAPAVLVMRAPRARLSQVPWMQTDQMQALLELAEFPDDAGLFRTRPPFSLVSVYDCVTEKQYLVLGSVNLLRQKGYVRFDVELLGGNGRFYRLTRIVATG
jgi:hypothetical protein